MRHLTPINRKARHIAETAEQDVVALQGGTGGPPTPTGPHIPLGCSFVFAPGSDKIVCERPYFDHAGVARALGLA